MSNLIKSSILWVFFFLLTMKVYAQSPEPTRVLLVPKGDTTQVLSYPLNVMAVIDGKCLGCHQPGAKSEKAMEKLQWEKLQSMDDVDLVAQLDEIMEVLEEGSMPPEKVIQKYPDLKLTDEETATLNAWTEEHLNKLMGE